MAKFVVSCLLLVISCLGCGDIEGDLASLTIFPATATVGINRSQSFTVTARDSLGLIIQVDPSWSVTGSIGTVSSNGLFTAGTTTGTGYVVVAYGTETARAAVSVTDAGWLEGRINSNFGYVPAIKVYLVEDNTLFDFSDSEGRYSIANIPAGTYEAMTEPTAVYQVASNEVTIERGKTEIWNFSLPTQPGIPDIPTTTLFTPIL